MKDTKLKQLFNFQKFEGNESLKFAIESTRNLDNEQTASKELSENELEQLNAAGITYVKTRERF
jgi:hypothetical protein